MVRDLREPIEPKKVYPINDIDYPDHAESTTQGWKSGLPIAIDLGTSQTRVGYATNIENGPQHEFLSQVSKYRDRKIGHTYQLVGNDTLLDSGARQNIKTPFDGEVIQNWDFVETMLDYSFSKINVESQGKVDNPIVMNEMLGCATVQRRVMNELMFESYQVPSIAYGIDSLFSFGYNNQNTDFGIVISAGNESSHIIPVVNGKGVMSMAKKFDYGGKQAAAYLQNLLSLKYPAFPVKLNFNQCSTLMQEHCYVSEEYEPEVSNYLDWEGITDRERVAEAAYTPTVVVEKSEEELARIAEKRRESGRRLQEQAAKARLEKLMEKEQNLALFEDLQQRIKNGPKKDIKKTLDREGFKNEEQLQKSIDDLTKAIRRARKLDLGDDSSEIVPPSFPLVDVPDADLNDEEIKEKRKQKLLKANYDARLRAKEEKEAERKRQQEEAEKDAEWRAQDLEGWIEHRRNQLSEIYNRRHEKQQLKEDLSNRKSHASQMRMKNIAALASDSNKGKRRRGGGGGQKETDDDTFGADDDDWGVYRQIANATDSEEEEEEERQLQDLQKRLETHDPDFRLEEFTREKGAIDWRDSVINMFLRGPRPYDEESQAQAHRMNLNIERIRVPEVLFQPDNVGLDCSGVSELLENILVKHWPGDRNTMNQASQNVFLTGGFSLLPQLDARVSNELRAMLPADTPLKVQRAKDARRDAWRGMALWSLSDSYKQSAVSRREYMEMGSEYMKDHGMGNSYI